MVNAAVDFGTRNNTVTGSIEYYFKRAKDLIALVPADPTTSTGSSKSVNSAILHGHGIDVNLESVNIDGAVRWTSNVLFSLSKNKVERYLYTPTRYSSYVGTGSSISPKPGAPAYSIVSYKWAGLDPATGAPRVYLNGEVSQAYNNIISQASLGDLVFHGPALPQYFGVLRNELSYKNFEFSFSVSYKFDYYFRRNTISYTSLYSQWIGHSDYASRWKKPGDELHTNVPALVYPANSNSDEVYYGSDIMVEKGDHIRLNDIRLQYTLGKPKQSAFLLNRLQIFTTLSNVGILWRANNKGIDPDFAGNTILPPRSVSAGLRAEF